MKDDQSSFAKWYAENKDEYNARRRDKYRKSAGLRKKASENAKRNRSKGNTVTFREYTRKFGDVFVTCYPISTVAAQLGRTAQLIREWEKKGYIPPSVIDDNQRLYTDRQVALLKELAAFFKSYKKKRSLLKKELPEMIRYIHKNWSKV